MIDEAKPSHVPLPMPDGKKHIQVGIKQAIPPVYLDKKHALQEFLTSSQKINLCMPTNISYPLRKICQYNC